MPRLQLDPAGTIKEFAEISQRLVRGSELLRSVKDREVAVGTNLPSTLTFNYPNVRALARYLLDELLDGGDTRPDGADEHDAPMGSQSALVDDELTEDELAALLAARLSGLQ